MIKVIDNFFPSNTINQVILEADTYSWKFIRTDNVDDIYWTCVMYGDSYAFLKKPELESATYNLFNSEVIENCWDFVKKQFPVLKNSNLESCYLNGLTYGVEAYAHIDNKDEEKICTIICYVCPNWNSHWSGETCFYSGKFSKNRIDPVYYSHEVEHTVLPKYNRIVMFDGDVIHAVKPLSKSFKGLRITLMFKLKGFTCEEILSGNT